MTVVISQDTMQAWAISPPRPDGVVEAWYMGPMLDGGLFCQFAAKFPAWHGFINVGGEPIFTDEEDVARTLLQTGGIYSTNAPFGSGPTWEELDHGDASGPFWTYPPSGEQVYGTPAMIARLQWWLHDKTTHVCELSTDSALFRGYVLSIVQQARDSAYASFVYPGDPVGRVPAEVLWPPGSTGMVASAQGLMYAHSSRITAKLDPANPNRTLVDAVPVP